MLTSFIQSRKTWVFSKNSDMSFPIGRLVDFVINPENGIFEALWIKTINGLQLIATKEILQWKSGKIIIGDESDLILPEQFPRIQKTIDKEVPILGTMVFVDHKCIGRVRDFSFDTLSLRILTIIVQSGFWFWSRKRIIPRAKIVKITQKGIFISENTSLKSVEKDKIEKDPILQETD